MHRFSRPLLACAAIASLALAPLVSLSHAGPPPGVPPGPPAGRPPGKPPKRFSLIEATIGDIHDAIRRRELTCEQLVLLYLARIKAYNGTCVDQPTGILGPIVPKPNAGQLNAVITLNLNEANRIALGFPAKAARTLTGPDDPSIPDAIVLARQLDTSFAATGRLSGPLHCITFGVKDAVDTFDLRTTGGADAPYSDDQPPDDATAAERLRAAGAIILAKTNMDEYGRGVQGRSSFGGQTCNPYATDRTPGGSSSGSGAGVAANLFTCAIAEETGGSVRVPATNNNIVGLLQTQGLVSRDGVIPLSFTRDRLGPHCRTVADAATVLDALRGYDPKDEATAASIGRIPDKPYRSFANQKSLEGFRLGVVREHMTEFTLADRDSIRIIDEELLKLQMLGATLVDPVNIQDKLAELVPYIEPAFLPTYFPSTFPTPPPNAIDYIVDMFFDYSLYPAGANIRRMAGVPANPESKYAVNRYLRERGDPNLQSLTDLRTKSNFFADFKARMDSADNFTTLATAGASEIVARRYLLGKALYRVMADNDLDALVYPMKTVPANVIGSTATVAPLEPTVSDRPASGWNGLGPISGFPDIVVPAGFTREVYDREPDPADPTKTILVGPKPIALPVAIDFLGRPYDEATLLQIASAYERATKHRRPPTDFPALPGEP